MSVVVVSLFPPVYIAVYSWRHPLLAKAPFTQSDVSSDRTDDASRLHLHVFDWFRDLFSCFTIKYISKINFLNHQQIHASFCERSKLSITIKKIIIRYSLINESWFYPYIYNKNFQCCPYLRAFLKYFSFEGKWWRLGQMLVNVAWVLMDHWQCINSSVNSVLLGLW